MSENYLSVPERELISVPPQFYDRRCQVATNLKSNQQNRIRPELV